MPKINYLVTNGTEDNVKLENMQIEVSEEVKAYLEIDAEKRYHWKAKKQKQHSFWKVALPNLSLEKLHEANSRSLFSYSKDYFNNEQSDSEFRLHLLFEDMSPVQKEAVKLHFIEGYNKTDLANELGKSESAVRQNIENGINSIKANFYKYKQYFNGILKDYFLETIAVVLSDKDSGKTLKQVYHSLKKKTLAVKSKVIESGEITAKFFPHLNKRVILFSKTQEIQDLFEQINILNTNYSIIICASRPDFLSKLQENIPFIIPFTIDNGLSNAENIAEYFTDTFNRLEREQSDKLINKYNK